MNSTLAYSLIMLIAGFGIPVMATLNGGLGVRLGSPAHAAAILFSLALTLTLIYLLLTEGVPARLTASNTPWYFYIGGFFVVFYILSITWVGPRLGISNAVAFVMLGQIVAMSIIDHYGLLGATQYLLTPKRILGILLMAAGVFLVMSKASESV